MFTNMKTKKEKVVPAGTELLDLDVKVLSIVRVLVEKITRLGIDVTKKSIIIKGGKVSIK